jgi:hypothetical protein
VTNASPSLHRAALARATLHAAPQQMDLARTVQLLQQELSSAQRQHASAPTADDSTAAAPLQAAELKGEGDGDGDGGSAAAAAEAAAVGSNGGAGVEELQQELADELAEKVRTRLYHQCYSYSPGCMSVLTSLHARHRQTRSITRGVALSSTPTDTRMCARCV